MTIDRRDRVLAGLDLAGQGLEIGGGYSPIALKADYRVEHLDHADQATLVAKYAAQGIDTSRIQPIDYVWSGQPYSELVGEKRYDWIIASHVIEHVPNPIGFLNDCREILTENGILSLIVPDKRFCFDYYRQSSGLARLIDAFVRGDTRTTAGAVAEHFMYAATVGGAIAWDASAANTAPHFLHTVGQAHELYQSVVSNGAYHDVHAWAFTPSSFRLVTEDLYQLGLIGLRELSSHDTEGCEFFVQLSRHGDGPGVARTALALAALSFSPPPIQSELDGPFEPMPQTLNLQSGEELTGLAQSNARSEILVQSTSGHPQLYLIREGRRHAIASPEWTVRHHYAWTDVIVVDHDVIQQVAEGEVLTP